MEINSSDESCHHAVIPTLPFFEMKQTYATLCSTSATPNASWDFPRAVCKAAPWWEPWHMGECKGCCAPSIQWELWADESGKRAIFSSCPLPGSLLDACSDKQNNSAFIALEQEQSLKIWIWNVSIKKEENHKISTAASDFRREEFYHVLPIGGVSLLHCANWQTSNWNFSVSFQYYYQKSVGSGNPFV